MPANLWLPPFFTQSSPGRPEVSPIWRNYRFPGRGLVCSLAGWLAGWEAHVGGREKPNLQALQK